MQTIKAKNVTPSINAAAMIIAPWMFPDLRLAGHALDGRAPIRPMPSPAPRMATPAPNGSAEQQGSRLARLRRCLGAGLSFAPSPCLSQAAIAVADDSPHNAKTIRDLS